MRCSRADDRLHPPACQTVPRVVMPPLSHILCARPPPPAKSKATLGSLSTAAITSGDASCELDYANNAPPSHSRDCERTWMGAGTDKTLHDRSQTPESAARRKRTGAPSEHFFLFLSLAKKRCKDDGMQKTVPLASVSRPVRAFRLLPCGGTSPLSAESFLRDDPLTLQAPRV
jgi:hypothetical protein